ncbi:hypothetical protein ACFCX4_09045 [Kitasatospora sp. NPDC056327]|uniref:hypothetical protein n=1 Tax=Kitasatospora sp. NPDC056327 TaxID=3345785 RepID=UPI0035DEB396
MNAYAITAAQATVPVTWTSQAGTTATAQMPTLLHTAYDSAEHTAAVVRAAESPQLVTPAVTTQASAGGSVMTGGALIGVVLLTVFIARWKHTSKETKFWFFSAMGIAILLGGWGLFGTVSQTVKTTGDSVGTSISNTVGNGGQAAQSR